MKIAQSLVMWQILLAAKLITDPEGSPGSWPCFRSSMPDGDNVPTEAVALFDTAGIKKGRDMRGGMVIEDHGCQIRVRAHEYANAWQRMDQIRSYLDGIRRLSLVVAGESLLIETIWRTHEPFDMGLEPNQTKRRHNIVLNVLICADALS
jgi:hypothetical protein